MGVDYQGLRFLLAAKGEGVSFEHPLMFGRQNFTSLSLEDAAYLFSRYGWPFSRPALNKWLADAYIEPLLMMLGAEDPMSVDVSPYEGATVVHDMNRPLPDELKSRFTVAIDFGTLEHVFNYPQALRNAMESVALGGHFLAVTICNGYTGHGFYQFSPELFFRVFSPENGFRLDHQYMCETRDRGEWYRCVDPRQLNRRAEITTSCRTYLLVQARRTAMCDIFANPPQQSDYASRWAGNTATSNGSVTRPLWKRLAPQAIKGPIRKVLTAHRQRRVRLRVTDRTAFVPVDD